MSRKDYIAIADALSQTKPCRVETPVHYAQWRKDVNAIADVLAQDNPRFDRGRFVAACNTQEQEDN